MAYPRPKTPGFEDVNFDGYCGKLSRGDDENPHKVMVVYGGLPGSDRSGKGLVVSNDGIFIHQWRRPANEGNVVVVNDPTSTEFPLSAHGL